ncbi:MAG TPA: ACP S-malonyltransferase [Pseudomonadales bacterium]
MSSKLAFVFPGQGSQSIGMLADLAEQYSVVAATFAEASDALGLDLWALVQNGPEAELNKTENTQPALLTASMAIWRAWQENNGIQPDMLAGHSLGEYSALVAAEVLTLADAVKLVQQRGRFMQQAVAPGEGAMAAIIGLEDAQIEQACADAQQGQVVSAVNYNAPGQVVIAGEKAAVDRAIELCKAAGAKRALPLPVSVPSHCALMQPAAEKLKQALEQIEFKTPVIPVVNNVDAKIETDADAIKSALVRQLYSPVRWVDGVNTMVSAGIESTYECGPGKVLLGLNKRIAKQLGLKALQDAASFAAAIKGD